MVVGYVIIDKVYEVVKFGLLLDIFNLMIYDFYGNWDKKKMGYYIVMVGDDKLIVLFVV